MIKIDIGCGLAKRPGFIGIDVAGEPDVWCDIASEPLPFDDCSADHIFSAHCLEHIPHNSLVHVFMEITRVAADGAFIELWHPHPFHGDAFVLGHINFLSEALYGGLPTFWANVLGATWTIEEVRYRVEPYVLEDMKDAGINIDFAICYMHDIVKEMGLFIRLDRTTPINGGGYKRSVCIGREQVIFQLAKGPRSQPLNGDRERSEAAQEELEEVCSNLRATLAQTITERDALAVNADRWFNAVIAITGDHSPLAIRPPSWRRLGRNRVASRRPSPLLLAERARDAGKWELVVRYCRDALDLAPDDPEIWRQLGDALTKAGKVSEGELAKQRSRELNVAGAGSQLHPSPE